MKGWGVSSEGQRKSNSAVEGILRLLEAASGVNGSAYRK